VPGYKFEEPQTERNTQQFKQVTVRCPDGKVPVGGGFHVTDDNAEQRFVTISENAPYTTDDGRSAGWRVSAAKHGQFNTNVAWGLTVRVACATGALP
jgi:hypothetical protein